LEEKKEKTETCGERWNDLSGDEKQGEFEKRDDSGVRSSFPDGSSRDRRFTASRASLVNTRQQVIMISTADEILQQQQIRDELVEPVAASLSFSRVDEGERGNEREGRGPKRH